MNLNIKSAEAHALAARLARVSGESMTAAVTQAIRERLARLERPATPAEELLALGRDCAARLREPWKSGEIGALLYDEQGLPR